MSDYFASKLEELCFSHQYGLTPLQIDQLRVHFELLLKWNSTHNLTTVTDIDEAIVKHYLDSIIGLQLINPDTSITDVGSGAGFPGIVAAVLYPHLTVQLLEPVRKKASFLESVSALMGLTNVKVEVIKVEDVASLAPLIVSRGTFSPPNIDKLFKVVPRRHKLALWVTSETFKSYSEEARKQGILNINVSWYELQDYGKKGIALFEK